MATQEEALPQDPQVFINYRGAELRYGFFSHLERALKRNGVNVYGDQELMLGAPLGNIFKVIEESRMAIVIFSSRYTESRWCLEELVRIKELVEEGKLVVIPVFYKLMVSEVKDLKGEFGEHFRDLAKGTSGDQIKKWKKVLDFVSQRMGLVFNEKSDEFSFINSIVTEVKIIEKSLDRLSEQQDDVFMDYPSSEDLKGLDGGRDGILWDKKSDRNPKEAEIVQPEGKSRRDDGLNPSKNDTVLKKKVDSVIEETKQDNLSESSTMVTYDKLLSEHPEVFINFHGADLCHGFVDHVAKALERDGVNVYIDVDELPHEDLTELLFKRIEESRIALVIFSQRYTESRWFLNKLVKIKEFMDEGNILVIPIFYKVEPFEVTQLKGDLGVKFWNLWRINRDHHIIKWKEAVESVASMVGIYSEENM